MGRAPAAQSAPPYRSEIDGLRAIAIVPVVLFHAGVPGFGGGFAGVDVFFVISGYLITGILARDAADGGVRFGHFYERRARRIIPALLPVLAFSLAGSWWLMIPDDFDRFSKALAATALFGSNVLFARRTDYFYSDDGFAPLLHTWSLSVEEQFYLVYPALIALAWRWWPRAVPLLVGAGCVAGFAAALLAQRHMPLPAFYMMPTRLWELLAGAACTFAPPRMPHRAAQLTALSGLAAIAAGFIVLGPGSAVPGPLLLLPVLGTAAVLTCGTAWTLAGRALSWRPLTIIGLSSYGLYLWHVPLLAFVRYQWLTPPPAWIAAAIAAAFALALASWRLIETPIRQGTVLRSRRSLAVACTAGLGVAVAIGAAGHMGAIAPRTATEATRLGGTYAGASVDQVVTPPGPLPFVLYGDSHARQYYPGVAAQLGRGALLSASACMAMPDASNSSENGDTTDCPRRFSRLTALVAQSRPPVVIWAQRWERPLNDSRTGELLGTTGLGPGAALLYRKLASAHGALPAGTALILVGNAPTAWVTGPGMAHGYLRCLIYRDAVCPADYPEAIAEGRAANAVLRRFAAATPGVAYVDAAASVCANGRCPILAGGRLYYNDGSHFTPFAAAKVNAAIVDEVRARHPR